MSSYTTFLLSLEPKPSITLTLSERDIESPQIMTQVWQEIDHVFSLNKRLATLKVVPDFHDELARYLALFNGNTISRQGFYQQEKPWHLHVSSSSFPLMEVQSVKQCGYHPLRPSMPTGMVYQRYDHDAKAEISFRVFDLEKDMDRLTVWMNDPRVADFWEQAWSKEKLSEFVQERLSDEHIIPLIGEFNGKPFGYVEAYWVSEDRLSPYYSVQSYDRGIHLLVGEQEFRGPRYFNCWMRAISHYLFIDDVRTQRLVLEPRADNERLFNRIKEVGYNKCFEFNFPHKRSALLMLERQHFFMEQW
jgi:acetyl CoA:N6-hydroxylysine acetyl transferase